MDICEPLVTMATRSPHPICQTLASPMNLSNDTSVTTSDAEVDMQHVDPISYDLSGAKGKRVAYSTIVMNSVPVSNTSSARQNDKNGKGKEIRAEHHKGKEHQKHTKRSGCQQSLTPIYITGIPNLRICEVKNILAKAPISIQLRHIGNISWIDGKIVELLVDTNHIERMQNRIITHSGYHIESSFDPLSPRSFNWVGDILPETKESIVKRNFVQRLGGSMSSTKHSSTRQHIMHWAQNRGLGVQLQAELNKKGIVFNIDACANPDNFLGESGQDPGSIARESIRNPTTAGSSRYLNRKRSYSSSDSIQT